MTEKDDSSKSFEDPTSYGEFLFTLSGTNRHPAGGQLAAKQQVRFQGIGAVIGRVQDGFGSDKEQPVTVYKVTADFIELI